MWGEQKALLEWDMREAGRQNTEEKETRLLFY